MISYFLQFKAHTDQKALSVLFLAFEQSAFVTFYVSAKMCIPLVFLDITTVP